ncbi:MAG: WGR domain-containing protein [Leptolyngbyaceae cyanobacterium RU_5_1]|nr:WGR domain-containing protein [Leptolyngbyaceae cyanobacterium RU_5_1]
MAKSKPTLPKPIDPIETVYLRCADEGENHYKFWAAWIASEGYIYVEYGRIGCKKPSVHVYECGTVSAAQNKLRSLISEKSRKGYEPGKPPTQQDSLNYAVLGSIATDIQQQIAHIQARFDTIKPYTSVEFDVQRGMFISQ